MDRDEYPASGGEVALVEADPREPLTISTLDADPGEPVNAGDAAVFAEAEPDADSSAVAATSNGISTQPVQVIEALLFSADTPLSAARLGELSGVGSVTQVRLLVCDLNDKYKAVGLSFRIEEIARGYRMLTLPQYDTWVARLNKAQAQTRLSGAALETLAIVAYKQPVIRAAIEAIRGVAGGEVLNRLREMGLVKIVGRAELVGRPLLYGTTRKFLDIFGLSDLSDLPPMETLTLRRPPVVAKESAEAADDSPREIPVAIGA